MGTAVHLRALEGAPHRFRCVAFISILSRRLKRLVVEELNA
jgi:hypothetical protein